MPTLVVLAAGIGNRYGSLKQVDPVGPHGATLIDYSIFDAIRGRFEKLVFIIRPVFEAAFRKQLLGKFEKQAECHCVYQETEVGVEAFGVPKGRNKPWGTGHAVLAAKEVVREPFAVINADDYYGRTSFDSMSRHLDSQVDANARDYAMVGYTLRNTLSEHGSVARGICRADEAMYLTEIVEVTEIFKEGAAGYYLDQSGNRNSLTGDEIVSMNLWGFTPVIFDHLEKGFRRFLQERGRDPKAEFFISSHVGDEVRDGHIRVKILPTHENWFGLTHKEDKYPVSAQIQLLIESGVYPEKLWD
jgi:UTP-glucose-1-phosphate uridylyltransferase